MATELKILSWCDVCLDAGENTPGETLTVAAGVVPPFDIEVCPRHAKPLAEAVAALAPHGRKVGTGTPKTPTAAPTRPPRPDQTPGVVDCPTCGHVSPSLSAMRQHLREEHGKSLADVGLADANHTCPECGSAYPNRQGLAAHVRLTHPAAYARQKRTA